MPCRSFYVTPTKISSREVIAITKFDPDDLLNPTDNLVELCTTDQAWERNIGSALALGWGSSQGVVEGSAVMFHDDKIFITYAGSTVDMHYAVGMLYANVGDDLMDAKSWKKYPYPVLSTPDLTTTIKENDYLNYEYKGEYKGTFGPGHNSITIDEEGNPIIVYHARDWEDDYGLAEGAKFGLNDPGRHAYANSIHFGADGFPIFNMNTEQQFSSDLENVSLKIIVKPEVIDISKAVIDVLPSVHYTGVAVIPKLTVKVDNHTLVEGRDYTQKVSNNINAGIAKIEIAGIGDYQGSKTVTFTILPKSIHTLKITGNNKMNYTGKALKHKSLKVLDGNKTLVNGTDYSIKYIGNVNIGKGTIFLSGIKNYTDTRMVTFKILPKKVARMKLNSTKSSELKIKWNKLKGGITGYEVICSMKKNFKNSKRVDTKKTNIKIRKMKRKTTYYIKVRAYKKVKGIKYFGNYVTKKGVVK